MSDSAQTPHADEVEREAADERPDEPDDESHVEPIETGADAVVSALKNAGVDHLFGVQGGAIMPVYDALYSESDMTHVTMAHEQGAVHAADAYGIVTGDPGVCMATSGPGATNLVTGIADASMDSDPLIALTGQVPTDLVGNDAFQETDTIGVTQPITKYNRFATSPDEVGDDVSTAFALADEGRQGPTLVDLPKDVTQPETDVEPGKPETPDTYNPPEKADAEAVSEAADVISDAEKPIILAGGGVIKANASDELRAFATEYDIPVMTTMPGTGAFDQTHELSMGIAGMHGTGYANMAITLTDCMLAIGTRFDDRLTGDVKTFAPDADIVHVDIDPAEISKNIEADYPLLGDAKAVLDQLSDAMTDAPDADAWREQCQTWKDEYPLDYEMPEDRPLKPQYIVEQFDEAMPDDTIVTAGVGQHQMWAWQYWTWTEPRTWVTSHGLGTMGYGFPAAIGAKLAKPDKEVIAFEGDGSFLMTSQELSVAVRENLDITIVVLNNEAVGMVRQWQDGFYEGRRMASEYPWVPEFDKLAEAYGARGFRLEDYDEVEETIEAALEYDGPAVVDAIIDPEENVYPMVPSGGDNSLFALSEDHLDEI
ncbi:acetolactate synthase, large subunit, biosynthetic type [Halorientalis sp. IM1011]|uniref:biosynthetic-type acetolactate synthase large subunit n=1 Tax=Halorientalis sp. IM1011 TaxID=1932360 RepID=UPI00097CCE28|nr:biosynthetic-type acetolactate synthase large subunit [Halorientalis sp. IM1011]AQL41246.1 acetolactate synthase, large subunit, biosynthetic type [Halorientalis sp. IM1011]